MYIRRNKKRKPKRIILDLDGTDDPTYGNQQLTFFHGYYDQYMYHPLVIYDADTGELITAVLRAGNRHASCGAVSVLKRIVLKIIDAFPKAEIIIRGDAGFAVPALYEYCETEGLTKGAISTTPCAVIPAKVGIPETWMGRYWAVPERQAPTRQPA